MVSQFAPIALAIVFALNVLSTAVAVDDQQLQVARLEFRYRGNPGPAEVERFEAAGFDAWPVPVSVPSGPSRAKVIQSLGELAPAAGKPRVGAFPVSPRCTSELRWLPARLPIRLISAQVFEQWDDKESCENNQHPGGMIPAEQEVAHQNQTQFAGHRDRIHTKQIPALQHQDSGLMRPAQSGTYSGTLEWHPAWSSVAESR